MNWAHFWAHFQAFLWLRWRLRVNQLKKAGTANAVISAILAVALLPLAAILFVGAFLVGLLALPLVPAEHYPAVVLAVWDLLVLGFLFLWSIGVLAELQRSEVLSLEKMLHLPVSLFGAFLINYLTSLFSINLLLLFLPQVLGLSLGLVFAQGPAVLLSFPLLAAFVLAVTAVTYQFQGWLASMMVNKRRRRTIIVMVTLGFVLLAQVPNMINFLRPWHGPEQSLNARRAAEHNALNASVDAKKITFDELQELRKKVDEKFRVQEEQEKHQELRALESAVSIGRLVNMILPVGWLPLGAADLTGGDVLPALLGTLGLTLIGSASLWRAYRTTLRMHTGQFTAREKRPVAVAESTAAKKQKPVGTLLVARELPWVSEQVAAIALASFRSLVRAPESKMLLLSPFIMLMVFGSMMFAQKLTPPEPVRFLMVVGAMAMVLTTMVQFIGNQFAFDRAGFRVFVLCPASRRDILLGKNLAVAPVALGLGFAMALVVEVAYPMRPDYFLACLVQLVTMYFLFCALANWLSILAPMPITPGTMKAANPKIIPILVVFAFLSMFPLALAPTLLPLGITAYLDYMDWTYGVPVCLPLSLCVCAVVIYVYRLVLPWQGRVLHAREQKILMVVTTKTD